MKHNVDEHDSMEKIHRRSLLAGIALPNACSIAAARWRTHFAQRPLHAVGALSLCTARALNID
jgi:hypothetical protein